MFDRRQILVGGAMGLTATSLPGCAGVPSDDYDQAVRRSRSALPIDPGFAELVRYASLAPSGHNTQPWVFSHRGGRVRIAADLQRRTPVVDPDDHHLYVGLGCAAENFAIAAAARGRPCAVESNAGRILIDLSRGLPHTDALFDAIPLRQSTRSLFDKRTIATAMLKQLEIASRTDGVSVGVFTDDRDIAAIRDLVVAGNNAQMDDSAFVAELRSWIRFNANAALDRRDGLYARSSGNPAIPSWIGDRFFGLVFTKKAEGARYFAQIASSSGIAVFNGDKADPDHWIKVGRSYERFALKATALGIRVAMINQAVEVPAVRRELARHLGIGAARPDLVVRFGHAPALPMSLRRPPEAIIRPYLA